uniref:Uncharacterized protein n=1 Tax=Erythrolobus australicus TaxID=1077150 RepID=A0A7S1TKQ8_9RHOD|mmetsp:Transcript_3045/g.8402  ORF Transcript_3045/g.8402 Transcript_3045/m.8402 type:complete len:525 (+) Transcript_3045:85-1659(+)|eukprot:CAMPEP_0185833958 /NCGR_PEP_ID=MMETSP1353-20130828/3671_1 /TAXON_ID=1077150 /ORGANISM="Erythrolobus australicus, Strain CCMP3124" /LENGTH=524 /DNA_ID=CAMNT_0028532303 /DNA_START=84 /DNA_END=1658 /DNA_ORIENTATION=-
MTGSEAGQRCAETSAIPFEPQGSIGSVARSEDTLVRHMSDVVEVEAVEAPLASMVCVFNASPKSKPKQGEQEQLSPRIARIPSMSAISSSKDLMAKEGSGKVTLSRKVGDFPDDGACFCESDDEFEPEAAAALVSTTAPDEASSTFRALIAHSPSFASPQMIAASPSMMSRLAPSPALQSPRAIHKRHDRAGRAHDASLQPPAPSDTSLFDSADSVDESSHATQASISFVVQNPGRALPVCAVPAPVPKTTESEVLSTSSSSICELKASEKVDQTSVVERVSPPPLSLSDFNEAAAPDAMTATSPKPLSASPSRKELEAPAVNRAQQNGSAASRSPRAMVASISSRTLKLSSRSILDASGEGENMSPKQRLSANVPRALQGLSPKGPRSPRGDPAGGGSPLSRQSSFRGAAGGTSDRVSSTEGASASTLLDESPSSSSRDLDGKANGAASPRRRRNGPSQLSGRLLVATNGKQQPQAPAIANEALDDYDCFVVYKTRGSGAGASTVKAKTGRILAKVTTLFSPR